MAKITYSSFVEQVNGGMGNVVYRKYKGRNIICRKGIPQAGAASEAQAAHQERFSEAADFGKLVMSDDTIRPLYEQAARERDLPVFAICIADFFNVPTIKSIDATDYSGKVGDPIRIVAKDDMGVVRVNVKLSNDDEGTLIESGQAVQTAYGQWTYTATQPAAPGITVQFQVNVFDRPGGTAVERGTKRI